MDQTPLTFSFDAALDFAVSRGWNSWVETARRKGVERTTEWLLRRDEIGLDAGDLELLIEAVLESDSPFDQAMAAYRSAGDATSVARIEENLKIAEHNKRAEEEAAAVARLKAEQDKIREQLQQQGAPPPRD